jgi:serine/threonine protein kinase
VNSRPYTRLTTLGRGGSSKVYKVISPQTNKIYALKKVSFDKADQSAIAGYKNEIRLLNRMAEKERAGGESLCIRLFDWESCDAKGYLLMVLLPYPEPHPP